MNRSKIVKMLVATLAFSGLSTPVMAAGGDEGGTPSRMQYSFPTYWVGPVPPIPPYGFRWVFSHYDYYGYAHWYLVRC